MSGRQWKDGSGRTAGLQTTGLQNRLGLCADDFAMPAFHKSVLSTTKKVKHVFT